MQCLDRVLDNSLWPWHDLSPNEGKRETIFQLWTFSFIFDCWWEVKYCRISQNSKSCRSKRDDHCFLTMSRTQVNVSFQENRCAVDCFIKWQCGQFSSSSSSPIMSDLSMSVDTSQWPPLFHFLVFMMVKSLLCSWHLFLPVQHLS